MNAVGATAATVAMTRQVAPIAPRPIQGTSTGMLAKPLLSERPINTPTVPVIRAHGERRGGHQRRLPQHDPPDLSLGRADQPGRDELAVSLQAAHQQCVGDRQRGIGVSHQKCHSHGGSVTDGGEDGGMTDLIQRYFDLAAAPDREAWFDLFADDVVVEDDGRTHRGIAEVRTWRSEVPSVSYAVTDVSTDGGYPVATADIAGDFPDSPIALRYHFIDIDDDRIRHLAIRP
jgi:hypothetical protein